MALSTPLVAEDDVIEELGLREMEFHYINGSSENEGRLRARVSAAIAQASVLTQKRVGTAYTSSDEVTLTAVRLAERALACHYMLRQRLVRLSSRPEEAPPAEYIDLDALREEIASYYSTWDSTCEVFAEDTMARPGLGFSISGKGIDETYEDETDGAYDETDYGDLPS